MLRRCWLAASRPHIQGRLTITSQTVASARTRCLSSAATPMQPPPITQPTAASVPEASVQERVLAQSTPRRLPSSRQPLADPFGGSLAEFQANYDSFIAGHPLVSSAPLDTDSRQEEVFANTDLPLSHIKCYGFDFDFTLAAYRQELSTLIFELAKDHLVSRMGYPKDILTHTFDPSFAIRGLHFDTRTGWILKLDQHSKLQTSTVFRGRHHVPLSEIVDAYRGVSITKDYREKHLRQMVDLFALAETNLLADTIQTFIDQKIEHSNDYIYRDIRSAIEHVHVSGVLHNTISANPGTYLDPNPKLGEYLLRLRAAGKTTFLLTNSPFGFVNEGMKFMLSDIASSPLAKQFGITDSTQWPELFDIVITSARKPAFFTRSGHFRRIDPQTSGLSWQPVREFKRGEVYTEGSLSEFTRLTSKLMHPQAYGEPQSDQQVLLSGHNVLYFGDHVQADLTAPWSTRDLHTALAVATRRLAFSHVLCLTPFSRQTAKWRTVAIVRELSHEIAVQQSPEFRSRLRTLLRLESLIDYGQRLDDEQTMQRLIKLKLDRARLKCELLIQVHPSFGSVFRTSLHRTEFFDSVGKWADVYTSNVNNFLNYHLTHCFYARRPYWPHETPQMQSDGDGQCRLI